MEKLTKNERENTLKNLGTIFGIMIIVYFITWFLWGFYENSLKNKFIYPYLKIRSSNVISVKEYPYKNSKTSIVLSKTDISNIYKVNTDKGSFEIKNFDMRYIFFENSNYSGLAYPSYDYRGMEYKLINTKGEIINFIITPNEELTNDLDEIAEFFFQYGNKAYINTDLGNSEILNIDSKYQKYTISSENLNGIKESKNYFYYEVNENNMKKIYMKDKDNKFIKEIIIK